MSDSRAIYALCDPLTNEVKYIGQADDPAARLSGHLQDLGEQSPKGEWLRELHSRGLRPVQKVLERVSRADSGAAEVWWIAYYLSLGAALTNRGNEKRQAQRMCRPSPTWWVPVGAYPATVAVNQRGHATLLHSPPELLDHVPKRHSPDITADLPPGVFRCYVHVDRLVTRSEKPDDDGPVHRFYARSARQVMAYEGEVIEQDSLQEVGLPSIPA
jgi:hypothetical protein